MFNNLNFPYSSLPSHIEQFSFHFTENNEFADQFSRNLSENISRIYSSKENKLRKLIEQNTNSLRFEHKNKNDIHFLQDTSDTAISSLFSEVNLKK